MALLFTIGLSVPASAPVKGACVWTRYPTSRSLCAGEDGVASFREIRAWNWDFAVNSQADGYEARYLDDVDVLPGVVTELSTTLVPKGLNGTVGARA